VGEQVSHPYETTGKIMEDEGSYFLARTYRITTQEKLRLPPDLILHYSELESKNHHWTNPVLITLVSHHL
jgi:hypothetical protein